MVKIKLLIVWVLVFICSVAVSAASTRSAAAEVVTDGITAQVQVTFDPNMPQTDNHILAAVPAAATVNTGSPYGNIFTWQDPTYQTYRRGYNFTGWNTEADGTGIDVNASTIVPNVAGPIVLYAKWTPKTMTVTFNPNGGSWVSGTNNSPNPNPFTVTYGTIYRNNTNYNWTLPTRPGMVFLGWNTSPNGTMQYFGPDALVSLTTDHTLYAIWAEMPETSVPEEKEVCYEGTVQMCAPANFSGYSWSPATGLDNTSSQCVTLTPASMTSNPATYTCLYTLGNIYNYNFSFGGTGFSTDYDILEDDPPFPMN